ncbi:hypothetical protein K461DRAFT_266033 [Myriangium duriaei CBS 260.36]|uniref:Transcription initiation factor TFIID subunit 2 n=1 Tax=Myriangium duriaei CBS 260.36 TaxID=1168546 RepID=A0A9P4J4V4_9PEZI|nr:hypothetical protein K461DRAFT_266033 [Myriangium duriaei CBS 260.36]
MPSLEDPVLPESSAIAESSVISQKVDLDIDFARKIVTGSTQIVAQPLSKDLKAFRLNCRQCRITRVTIEGKPATITHVDPYDKVKARKGASNIHQYDYFKSKIAAHVKEAPDPELQLALPPRVTVKELDADGGYTAARPILKRKESETGGPLDTPTLQEIEQGPRFAPLKIYLEFRLDSFRDGLHWVGFEDGDGRFPHVYTRNSPSPGNISSVFPCIDNVNSRCMWEISITCPKTLGDAFRKPVKSTDKLTIQKTDYSSDKLVNGVGGSNKRSDEYSIIMNEEERALDLNVICSGEMIDDVVDSTESSRRTVSFACASPVAARHIGFAVGPFEMIDLSAEFRQADEDEKLGQSAIKVLGYCLPGRSDELRNTCLPMSKAIDYFTVTYGTFPFPNYKICFVDDLVQDFADTAGLSICSNRLLFPESIIDTLDPHTRLLIQALSNQYCGVNIIPKESTDLWAVVGTAGFMADMFMKKLAGNNEYRLRQKLASDKVFEQDIDRYSLHQLGGQLDIDPSEFDFMQLKASLVLFILDRRLTKQSGSAGMNRIITRIFLNAKTGDLQNGELTTEYFLRTCEKLGHAKLDSFFKQWVYNAGCPDFMVTQKFNKKKLVVEMTIQQMQSTRPRKPNLLPLTFMREAKEQVSEAYAPEVQPAFTGPMTIRIHEADGTPYEHIVEIKDVTTKFEIPYNTKYKRLKRSKRAKERSIAINGPEQVGDSQDDVLLYCLGDTLQTEQEVKNWFLVDWTEQQENQMGQESYEWIRMDADFEWIGRMNLNMPIYMYVSQLQQDRDVVAQFESVQRIVQQEPHPMGSTILTRTLMDRRYFHGIRTTAATGLVKLAVPSVKYIGLFHLDKAFSELFCFPDNPTMPRPNDFSDRANYLVQCTIPKAMAMVRDPEGRVPLQVRKFLSDKIKFNDNTHNENNENISDCYYLSMLTECLVEAVASMAKPPKSYSFNFDEDEQPADTEDDLFRTEALSELERYRNSDEWTPSFQNITTVTAIGCIERLIEADVSKDRAPDILAYSRRENADNVRLRAFQAMVNLKLTKKPAILRYLLDTLSDDPSPYFRDQLMRVFGQALGIAAIGLDEIKEEPEPQMEMDAGLVLEQDVQTEARQLDLARKSSPEGALNALKQRLENDQIFKEALWSATLSRELSLVETSSFLDIAALLFEPSSMQGRLILTLPLPRKWAVRNKGQGKLRFFRSKAVQTRPSKYQPMSQKDFRLVKDHDLSYNGPLARQAENWQAEEQDLAAKIAATAKELEKQQKLQAQRMSQAKSHMSPPPLPTPTESGSGVVKLSLKRKQSVDVGRASSPKAQKITKTQTPNSSIPSTPVNGIKPPPINKSRPSGTIVVNTPGPKPVPPPKASTSKATPSKVKSRIVKLRFPTKSSRMASILSTPGKGPAGRKGSARPPTPSAQSQSDGYFPKVPSSASPQPSNGAFPGSLGQVPAHSWNVGGFRNFSSSSDSPAPAPIKNEPEDGDAAVVLPPSSPDDIPLAVAQQRREASVPKKEGSVAPKKEGSIPRQNGTGGGGVPHPPVPTRKITLKLGKKSGGAQSPT